MITNPQKFVDVPRPSVLSRLVYAIIGALAALALSYLSAYSQVIQNPTNFDVAFCNVRGAVAVRTASRWQCLPPGSAGYYLQTQGAGADVVWANPSAGGTVTSIAATFPAEFSLSGSPITTSGTLAASWVSQSPNLLFASPNGTSGTPSFRALVGGDLPNPGASTKGGVKSIAPVASQFLTGISVDGTPSAAQPVFSDISGALDNSRLASMADGTVKSNISGGAGVPADNTISAVLDKQFGTVRGSVVYRGAVAWEALVPGTSGQFLQTQGSGANPQWAGVSGANGGTVTSVASGTGLTGGPVTTTGTLSLASIAADQVLMNASGAGAVPSGVTLPNCVSGQYLTYSTTTHLFTCSSVLASIAADSVVMNASGASAAPSAVAVPNCGSSTQALGYSTSSHAFACQTITGSKASDRQVFNSSGTWTKPTGYGANAVVFVQVWGAGGGAGINNSGSGSGGAGGGYSELWILLSSLGSTETVTIGAGGAKRASGYGSGSQGGNTSFGTWSIGYGGGGGAAGAGVSFGGGVRAASASNETQSPWRGGQGRYVDDGYTGQADALMAGGGGGSNGAGGVSRGGGNGGGAGQAGVQPGGGGGGAGANVAGGDGGSGRVVITVFDGS